MSINWLFLIILAQVLVFQFLSRPWIRALLGFRLGLKGLPPEAAARLMRHDRRSGRLWLGAGALLLLCATGLAVLPPLAYPTRKIGLALVSLGSSVGLLAQLLSEGRSLEALAAMLPDPALRSASLAPRELSQYYPRWGESLPGLILLATVIATLLGISSALPGLPAPSRTDPAQPELWLAPFAQLVFLVGGWFALRRLLHGPALLTQKGRAALGDPSAAAAMDESLRRLKIRGFYAARLAALLMFALMQARAIYAPGDRDSWLATSTWAFVGLMLGIFAVLMVRIVGLRKTHLP